MRYAERVLRAPPRPLLVSLLALVACNNLVFGDVDKVGAKSSRSDGGVEEKEDEKDPEGSAPDGGATPDAATIFCSPQKPFTSVVAIAGQVNSAAAHEVAPSLTADEKTIVFQRTVGADGGSALVATRGSVADPFGPPTELPIGSGLAWVQQPSISTNGLAILFVGPASDVSDVFRVQRTSPTGDFGARAVFAPANSIQSESFPAWTQNDEEVWVSSDRHTGGTFVRHLYRSVRDAGGNYSAGARATELESAPGDSEFGAAFSADGLTIYFASDRTGEPHVFTAQRPSIGAPFGAIVAPVNELNSAAADIPGWVSRDNCRFYFSSERNGMADLFVATRIP
jgi:hypothetical protein